MIIQKAWRQKITMGEKPLFFDHDYTATVLQQRKVYTNIKKALKEKGIRFHTPFNRMSIHWDSVVQTYGQCLGGSAGAPIAGIQRGGAREAAR